MKKRIISVLLIMLMLIVMLFTLSGCGNDNPKEKSKDDESEQATNNDSNVNETLESTTNGQSANTENETNPQPVDDDLNVTNKADDFE